MNSKYLKYLPIFLIFILGGISITWTNSHSLLNTGDFLFPTEGVNEFYAILHSWDLSSLGSINYLQLGFIIPYGIYLAVIHWIGTSFVYSQIVWNYLLLTSMGLSMYFLVIVLIRDETKYLAGLITAIFFMFNPWTGQNIAMFFPFITFIPLVLGLYIKGLNENKNFKYLILCSLIWWFVSSFSLRNFRGYIFLWIMIVFYLFFFVIHNRKKIRHALVFTLIFIVLHVMLNAHWLFLFFTNVLKSASGSIKVYEAVDYSRFSSFETASSTMMQALRMLADWSQTANIKGVLHFPWLDYYRNPVLIFVGFLLPFSAFVSLFYVMRRKLSPNRHFIFFFILLLFGYFISMGKYNLFGMWLADKFKFYLLIFSAPAVHGGIFIVISYSVLLAYSFVFVSRLIKSSYLRLLVSFLYILVIIIYGFPIISGQFIPSGNKLLGAGRYEIPKYVFDLKKKINEEGLNYRIFSVPYSKLGYTANNWIPGGYNGPDPLVNVLSKSQVMDTGIGAQIADTTTKNIDKTSFFRLNSLLNVKYIINKRDANLLHIKNNSWYTVPSQNFLDSLYQNDAEVSTFGQIDLIKVPDELFLPKLYIPLKIFNTNDVSKLPNIVSQNDYVTRSAIYLGDNNVIASDQRERGNLSTEKTVLEYRMISPVKYRVRVHNAEGVFPLVMSESFHEGWKTYLAPPDNFLAKPDPALQEKFSLVQGTIQNDDLPAGPISETWFKKPIIEEKNHLMVNGYANSWLIDTNKICNFSLDSRRSLPSTTIGGGNDGSKCNKNADGSYDFELIIEFWPQRIYYFGLFISITTLVSCIGYLITKFVISKKSSDSEDD